MQKVVQVVLGFNFIHLSKLTLMHEEHLIIKPLQYNTMTHYIKSDKCWQIQRDQYVWVFSEKERQNGSMWTWAHLATKYKNIGPNGPELICHFLHINCCTRSVEILCVSVFCLWIKMRLCCQNMTIPCDSINPDSSLAERPWDSN